MRGEGGYIYSQGTCSIILRDTWYSNLPPTLPVELTSFGPKLWIAFYLLFWGSFWGPFDIQNRSCMVPLEILRSLLSNDIKFAQIGSRTEKLWLSEVGMSEHFFVFFRRGFRPNRRCCYCRRTESCTSQAKLPSFLKFLTCGSTCNKLGRLCARRRSLGWKNVSDFQHNFLTFANFLHIVDMVPDVGFWWSWCLWKDYDVFFGVS